VTYHRVPSWPIQTISYAPSQSYWNPGVVAYPDEPHEPVPGWGMRPNMVGPARVGVGATEPPAVARFYDALFGKNLCCSGEKCCTPQWTLQWPPVVEAYYAMTPTERQQVQAKLTAQSGYVFVPFFERLRAAKPPAVEATPAGGGRRSGGGGGAADAGASQPSADGGSGSNSIVFGLVALASLAIAGAVGWKYLQDVPT